MHILIIDHSVIAYKSYMRLFSQDYEGETDDDLHEFTRQYVSEIVYLQELHRPDGILFAMDCPREDIWRHRVVRRFYGPKMHVHPTEWYPGTEDRNAENACRWYAECFNSFKEVFLDADGTMKSKHMTKSKFTSWASVDDEVTRMPELKNMKMLKQMLPLVAKMYKGKRGNKHFPKSAGIPKEQFKEIAKELCLKIAPCFGARVVGADELEADDIAYTAVARWYKHDITVATIDNDWAQLGYHMYRLAKDNKGSSGTFRFWNANKYEFLDADISKIQRMLMRKLLTGDDSDNIESARLKGQSVGIGDTKADKIFDEVPQAKMFEWLKEHGNMDTLVRNSTLIDLAKCPEDLQERAKEALLDSAEHLHLKPTVALEELVSESSLNLAKIDGQKAHQKHVLLQDTDEESTDEQEG